MSSRTTVPSRSMKAQTVAALVVVLAGIATVADAGHQFFRNGSVGGVSIDTEGVLRNYDPEGRKLLLDELKKDVADADGELNIPTGMRKISLKGLEAAIVDAVQNNLGVLPEEVRFLAGLQRIQYILVDEKNNDVIIAGPGEGWRVDENAHVVGVTTGRPVMMLDDLLVAFREVHAARQGGISCSIEPTAEGVKRLNALLAKQTSVNRRTLEPRMKEAFGPQQIKVTGVPTTSHFARILVAADYRMKRLAMGLDKSPVDGLPSYVEMVKKANVKQNPRWWLACNYQPIAKSEDGLAWEIRGPGVKCMTENQFYDANGKAQVTKSVDRIAQLWAKRFTEKYEALVVEDAAFGYLRNLMDMCVAAALIEKEHLMDLAGCQTPVITGHENGVVIRTWNAPKTVEPQCSFLRTRKGWVVTASGGVQIESWQIAEQSEVVSRLSRVRAEATESGRGTWWWN